MPTPIADLMRAEEVAMLNTRDMGRVELWHGVLARQPPRHLPHGIVVARLMMAASAYAVKRPPLIAGTPHLGYLLTRDPDSVICTDFSIYAKPETNRDFFVTTAPLLAGDVVSNNTTPADLERRKAIFFAAGTAEYWVIDTSRRLASIHRPGADSVTHRGGVLHAGEALEGFNVELDYLLRDAAESEPAPEEESAPQVSAEELSPEQRGTVELWRGRPSIMEPLSPADGGVVRALCEALSSFLAARPALGLTTSGIGFLLRRNPDLFLLPDLAIHRTEDMRVGSIALGVPLVWIQVMSEGRIMGEMMPRCDMALNAGAQECWVLRMAEKAVVRLRRDGTLTWQRSAILRGEGTLEGLEIDLDELFSHA